MTDSFDTAPDLADRPRHAAMPPSPSSGANPSQPFTPMGCPAPRRSRFGRVFRWWLGIGVVLSLAFFVCVAIGIAQFDFLPLHIMIDGDDITDGVRFQGITDGGKALLGIGGVLAALLVLTLMPALLMLVMAIVLCSLVVGLGLPLLALAAALVAVSSPLWLIGGLVWLVVRDRHPRPRPAPSATMNA